jgi:cysteine desulfurase
LFNTSSISFAGIDSQAALMLLDRHRICCSAGSACRTGSTESSHVLRAMQLSDERTRGALRFSFGRFNTQADLDQACEIIPQVIEKLRALSSSSPTNVQPQPALQTLT